MPVLTNITAQRRAERVNLHIDGDFWSGAPVAVVAEAGLKVGMELTDEALEELAERILVREAIESCLRRLALRGRTRRELAQGLKERKFDEHVAEQALDHLDRIGMLNDRPVAQLRVESLITRGAGPRKIAMELGRVGVDPDLRSEVMEELITHERLVTASAAIVHRRFGAPPYPREVHARADRWMRAQGHSQDVIADVIGRPEEREAEADEGEDVFRSDPRPVRPRKDVDALALLRRKYPRAHRDSGENRRAVAFLQRRGVGYEEIRQAIESLAAEDEAA